VMILGEMCVSSLVYSYVAVCRFCAVRYLIICFSLLFSNCSTYVFNILFMFVFCFVFFVFYFEYSMFLYFIYCFSLCAVSFVFLYKSSDHCHRVKTQLQ